MDSEPRPRRVVALARRLRTRVLLAAEEAELWLIAAITALAILGAVLLAFGFATACVGL